MTSVSGTFDRVSGTFDQDINTITLLSTPKITLQQQQHGEAEDAAAAADCLLEGFEIPQPFKGRILAKCTDVITFTAWMLYAITQTGLTEENGKQKYVHNRLTDGDEPPARFMRYATLAPDEWRVLWRASQGDRSSLTPQLSEIADEWGKDFGGLFPRGPFGDDEPVQLGWATPDTPAPQDVPQGAPQEPIIIDGQACLPNQVWRTALGELQLQLTGATYDTWLGRTRLIAYEDGKFVIGVHNKYAQDWLENRLLSLIKRTLTGIVGRSVEVQFVVSNGHTARDDESPGWLIKL